MGCIPSKKSLDEPTKPEMSVVARTTTCGSSTEQFSERPHSPSSINTKLDARNTLASGVPIPPRVDCIAPRPRHSEESLRRRKANDDQAHQESATTATAVTGGTVAGAAVHADNGAAVGGGDAGGGSSGGDGGGGGE
ncbi:hypothetical protein ACGC1H_002327 [Rhizoctonia solani]